MPSSPLKVFGRKQQKKDSPPPVHLPVPIDEETSLRGSALQLQAPPDDYLIDVSEAAASHDHTHPGIFATSVGNVKKMRIWDVKMSPIKKSMVGGHLVPTIQGGLNFLLKKKRKVSLEIRKTTEAEADVSDGVKNGSGSLKLGDLADGDALYLRVFKRRRARAGGDDAGEVSDDVSVDESVTSDADVFSDDDAADWREHRSYKLEDVSILKSNGKVIEHKTGKGNDTIVRDLKFERLEDAASFIKIYNQMVALEQRRTKRQIARYKDLKHQTASTTTPAGAASTKELDTSGTVEGMQSDDKINILVEIVSASDLLAADMVSSDPYVKVLLGGKQVHKTNYISNTLDPVWTLKNGAYFILSATVEEFFGASSGLSFYIKDFDAVGKNESLGEVFVPHEDLINGTGERKGYEIIHAKDLVDSKEKGKDYKPKKGYLYLRMKEASDEDIKFMENFQEQKKANKTGVYIDECFLPFRPPQSKLMKRQTKRGENHEQLHRVRPFPDPAREEETTWLTKEAITAESLKPSMNWVEAGSGELGKLYVEVLGCTDLPNMDTMTTNVRDKSDAFGCLVFEDSIVMTDVIGDTLSPRWMPWSQRAFVFNISHPTSSLQLGIFDFDPESSPLQMMSRATSDIHDPIGRIQLHMSNFTPDTEYTLTYPLYFGQSAEQRKDQMGTITIRYRMDWLEPRKALLAAAMPPPSNVVSVARAIDFAVADYTIKGPYDDKEFNLTTLTGHIEELQSYERVIDILKHAAMAVWLWRGHYPVKIRGKEYLLPLHSVTLFLWGILVTWNFNTFPSFVLFSIGWALVAINEHINKNPSPWHRCLSYGPAPYNLLVFDRVPPIQQFSIEPNQNLEAIEAYNKAAEEKDRRWEREKKLEAQHEEDMRKEMGEEMDQADEEVDIESKKGGFMKNVTVNPLKPVLYPIQLQLRSLVIYARIAKGLILWEECYMAFWITTMCFIGSFILIWIPFGFLLRWISRIAAWVVLGPWMALVDRYYFGKEDPNLTDAEKDAIVKERLRARYEEVKMAATHYQIKIERAKKLKSMKKYMFGKFLLSLPRLSEDLYKDYPLPESYAKYYDKNNAESINIVRRVYGQNLSGDMIPKREIQASSEEEKQSQRSTKRSLFRRTKNETENSEEKTPLLGRLRGTRRYDGIQENAAEGE